MHWDNPSTILTFQSLHSCLPIMSSVLPQLLPPRQLSCLYIQAAQHSWRKNISPCQRRLTLNLWQRLNGYLVLPGNTKIFPYSTHFPPLSWWMLYISPQTCQYFLYSSFLAYEFSSYLAENTEVITRPFTFFYHQVTNVPAFGSI